MFRVFGVACACLLFAAACGGDGNDEPGGQPTSPAGQPAATQLPNNGAALTPSPGDATGALPRLAFDRVLTGISLNQATAMVQAPDGSWWALEKPGRVLRFENRNDAQPQVALDISDRVQDSGGEEGLLGIALAPDFATSRVLYLAYTAPDPRRDRVSRFVANAGGGTSIAPGSETVVIETDSRASNHNGGQLAFGPDGYLYIAYGDGGSGASGNGQELNTLLGKILRIDISSPSGGLAYTVPPDNPFAGRANARPEIWAYGLRNPWRFSIDAASGRLWAGDVGQNAREEIDLIEKGGNYGWSIMEGSQCSGGSNCDRAGLTPPVIDYATASGRCAVIGGFVYRGSAIPSMRGAYVYGDYCSGEVFALRYDGTRVTEEGIVADLGAQLSSFAQDSQGEVYALAFGGNGGIFKLVAR